jgi:phage-related protein
MGTLFDIEVEPVVPECLDRLSDRDFGRVDFLVGLLAEQAETLDEPYSKHLGGKVRELRFHLLSRRTRVTYWPAPNRRVVLLTVFHKTRANETREVQRAIAAQRVCEAGHPPAQHGYQRPGDRT